MKNNKGITLISLIAYVILAITVVAMLTMISSHFRSNLSNLDEGSIKDIEFDKLNLQLLKEIKTEDNFIDEEKTTSTELVFLNGNTYTYNSSEKAIYLNNNIKIAEEISAYNMQVSEINNKQSLKVTVTIEEITRTTEYIGKIAKCNHNWQNGICTICGETEFPIVLAGKKATETSSYSDGTNTAMIPAKFTVSGASTENTIAGGLVIYLIDDKTDAEIAAIDWTDEETLLTLRESYDQFVWIPIKNTTDGQAQDINDMYLCQNKGTGSYGTEACVITVPEETGVATCSTHGNCTAMAGRLCMDIAGDDSTYIETYLSPMEQREPDTLANFDGNTTYLGNLNSILGTNYLTESDFKTGLQIEYNAVVKSVYLNQGFYVGRFETSNVTKTDGISITVQAGKTAANLTNWYYLYAQQKDYAINNNLKAGSTMIQGAAYDQMMLFVNTEEYNVEQVGEVKHNFSSPYDTGSESTDKSKNIYDLEGNVTIWTTEIYPIDYRYFRGGHYDTSYSASFRGGNYPSYDLLWGLGSMCLLYIL